MDKKLNVVCVCETLQKKPSLESIAEVFVSEHSGVRDEDIELVLAGKQKGDFTEGAETILGRFKVGHNDWYGIWDYNKNSEVRSHGIFKKEFAEALALFHERTLKGSEVDPQ